MTEREFSQKLRRGFGSAILELKENPDRDKYRDIILRCCFRDSSYASCEGSYLYSAICTLGDKDYFEKILCGRFLLRCPDRSFYQMADILSCYANDGSEPAKDALRSKCSYFAAKKERLAKASSLDEATRWNRIAFRLLYIDGFNAFERYILDQAEFFRRNPQAGIYNNGWFDYVWLKSAAERRFGMKRTNLFLDRMYKESSAVRALIDKVEEEKTEMRSLVREPGKITIDALLHAAREAALNEAEPIGALARYRWGFMKNASDDELLELACAILRENDETIKGLLLRILWRGLPRGKAPFYHRPFPPGTAPLLECARSTDKILSETAIALLADFKEKTIHDAAIQLLEEKGLDSGALALLKKNYQKADDAVLHRLIKKASAIPPHVQDDIGEIYLHHRSVNAFPILLRVYQKGDGAFFRYYIVKAMKHNGVLPDDILEECLYDSDGGTRTMAERIKRARKKLNSEI